MIGCNDAMRQLWEYLDGVVDEVDKALIEEHLARCQRCCGEREFAEELRAFLATHADDELPDDIAWRLNQTLEDLGQ